MQTAVPSKQTEVSSKIKVHCAVGIILNDRQEILIAKRHPEKIGGGFWEFPGGKIEPNELPEEALVRELQEELGITPIQYEPFLLNYVYDAYPHHHVTLEVFLIRKFAGEPKGLEGQPIEWVSVDAMEGYSLLEANVPMVNKIKSVL